MPETPAGLLYRDARWWDQDCQQFITGSRPIAREPSLLRRSGSPPESLRRFSVPLDEDGNPYEWCSGYLTGGHHAPRRAFNKNRTRANGLQKQCRACQFELAEHQKATAQKTT